MAITKMITYQVECDICMRKETVVREEAINLINVRMPTGWRKRRTNHRKIDAFEVLCPICSKNAAL